MAKLNIECRPNGDVKYNLEFLGCAFDMTMIANEYGAEAIKKHWTTRSKNSWAIPYQIFWDKRKWKSCWNRLQALT